MNAEKRKFLQEVRNEATGYYTQVLLSPDSFENAVFKLGMNLTTFGTYGRLVSEELYVRVKRKELGNPYYPCAEDIANYMIKTCTPVAFCTERFGLAAEILESTLYSLMYGNQGQMLLYLQAKIAVASVNARELWRSYGNAAHSMVSFVSRVRVYKPTLGDLKRWMHSKPAAITTFVYLALLSDMPETQREMIDAIIQAHVPIAREKREQLEEASYIFAVRATETKSKDKLRERILFYRDICTTLGMGKVKKSEDLLKLSGHATMSRLIKDLDMYIKPFDLDLYNTALTAIQKMGDCNGSISTEDKYSEYPIYGLVINNGYSYDDLKSYFKVGSFKDIFAMLDKLKTDSVYAYRRVITELNAANAADIVRKVLLSAEKYIEFDGNLDEACKKNGYSSEKFVSSGLTVLSAVSKQTYMGVLTLLQSDGVAIKMLRNTSTVEDQSSNNKKRVLPEAYVLIVNNNYDFGKLAEHYGSVESAVLQIKCLNKLSSSLYLRALHRVYKKYSTVDARKVLLVADAVVNRSIALSVACKKYTITEGRFFDEGLPILKDIYMDLYIRLSQILNKEADNDIEDD